MIGHGQNKDRQMSFSEIFLEYRILTERQKIRWNTRDNYGLGSDWYFVTGAHVDGIWTVVYAKLTEPVWSEWRRIIGGQVEACTINRSLNGVYCKITPEGYIGEYFLAGNVRDIPSEVLSLVR